MYSIVVDKLRKEFGNFVSVNSISFNVEEGEIFGFLGANGAGKSTTIRMLCGILEPTAGDAFVGGYSIKKEPEKVKLNIGYMSQKFSLYNDLTVEENINFFGGLYGLSGNKLKESKKRVLLAADLVGKEHIKTSQLPGGIKQRLALSTAVLHNPKIVFLDEPTSGVDPISRRNFWDLINQLSEQGITVFVTTHYLEEAEFCNNIILINAGNLIAEGSPKKLKEEYINNNLYQVECNNVTEALTLLSDAYFVDESSIFGNNIHISLLPNFSDPNIIKQFLSDNNIHQVSINKISPSLEDVFIHLLEKENKNAK